MLMKKYLPFFLLLGIVFLTYSNTLWNGFTYDDREVISESQLVKKPYLITTLFTKEYFTNSGEATYRPVVTLTYFLEYRIFREHPWGYHLMNLIYHLIMVFLIYFWLKNYFSSWASFGGALIFGIHPVLSEAVNSIGYREDILTGIFLLGALLIHRTNLTTPTRLKSFIALFLLVLALFSKEMAITFPLLCVLTDYIFYGKPTVKTQWKQYLMYVLVCSGYLVIRFWLMANPVKEYIPYFGGSISSAILSIPKIIALYFQLIIFPAVLHIDRNIIPIQSILTGTFWASVILGAGIIFAIIKSPNIYRWGLLWFLIALLPVVNIIPIYNPFGERYLYLPFIGIAGIIAYTLHTWHDKRWIWSILAICLLGLSIRTIVRNRDWHNDYTLFSQAAKYPSGPRVYFNLANEYRKRGQVELAIQSYQQAIQRAPQFIQALHNLATLYTEQGNFPAAVSVFQQAIRVNPNSALLHNGLGMTYAQLNQLALAQNEFQHAIALQPDYSEAHHNLGIIYLKTNQIESAISEFKLAIQFQPDFLLSYDMLASIYISQNKLNDALTVLQTALQKSPERIELLQNLAKVYQQLNRVQETITIFQQILKTNPNYIPALNDLAWLYATSSDASIRNGYKAVALALQAAKLTKFSDANILDTLAAAYAETGEFTRAIEYIQQAINLTSDNNLRTQFHARLKRYHKKSPYRE